MLAIKNKTLQWRICVDCGVTRKDMIWDGPNKKRFGMVQIKRDSRNADWDGFAYAWDWKQPLHTELKCYNYNELWKRQNQ